MVLAIWVDEELSQRMKQSCRHNSRTRPAAQPALAQAGAGFFLCKPFGYGRVDGELVGNERGRFCHDGLLLSVVPTGLGHRRHYSPFLF